jgi:hypothetical protein
LVFFLEGNLKIPEIAVKKT